MPKKIQSDVASLMEEDLEPKIPSSTEEQLRLLAQQLRDAKLEEKSTIERLEEIKKKINNLEQKLLPEVLERAGTDHYGLPADGNFPASDVVLKNWYEAKLPEGEEQRAYEWMEDNGHGSIVKHRFTITFDRGEEEEAVAFRAALDALAAEYDEKLGVNYQTLQAWVREQIETYGEVLPADILGIRTGVRASITERRERQKKRR